jgi:hypothetical protein
MPLWDHMLERERRICRNVTQVEMIRHLLEEKNNYITSTYETALHGIDEFVFGL